MKLVYSYFDETTGESIVKLADRYGSYVGKAFLHPDDSNYKSKYMGCGLAERRAAIKGLKNRRRRVKIKLNTIENIITDIKTNIQEPDENILKRLYFEKKKYSLELTEINNNIEMINKVIEKRIKIRNNIINKIKKGS